MSERVIFECDKDGEHLKVILCVEGIRVSPGFSGYFESVAWDAFKAVCDVVKDLKAIEAAAERHFESGATLRTLLTRKDG